MTLTVKKPVRQTHVLVVDDHPVVRLGIRQMIAAEPDLSVCAEADTPDAALNACRSSPVDLKIVDLSLGSTSGMALIKVQHDEYPTIHILALSMHTASQFAHRSLCAGALCYLLTREA